ncbi:hypothetical protein ACJMK2_009320 [Sinanodonta woodiana]|uniref:BTB domain-containing protein n=1 Tax=Sinanodonta woodiana TaxID=1069815 RepID=A0ABD3VBW6_SINWO
MSTDWKLETAKCLHNGIFRSYRADLYTDIEIQVEKKAFKCHKVVLSAFSDYFQAMFSSGMKESHNNTICLKDIGSIVFETILKFAYSGEDVVTVENAEDLLRAAVQLQITCLQERCEHFLLEQTTAENCIGIWRLAQALHCNELHEKTWQFILDNFDVISHVDEFGALDKAELISVISNDDLKVSNEEYVCDALIAWLQKDESRKSYLSEVFKHMRLKQVSLQYLLEKVDFHPYIRSNPVCSDLIKEALNYHLHPEKRELFQVPLRNGPNMEVIFLIGKTPQGREQKLIEVYCFCPKEERWYSLPPLLSNIGRYFACCVYGDYVYVSGGTERPVSCFKLHIGKRDWIHCRSMNFGRLRHGMVSERDAIYVLGGFNPISDVTYSNIEKYTISDETWTEAGELACAVDALSCVPYKGKIYVFGGWLKDCEHAACIQCFDTESGECTIIDCLPDPVKFSRCAQGPDGTTYIVYPTGKIVRYCPENGKLEEHMKVVGFRRYNFGLTYFHGKLYIFGGESDDPTVEEGTELCSSQYEIDLEKRETRVVSDAMPSPFEAYGSVKIILNKDFLLDNTSEQSMM